MRNISVGHRGGVDCKRDIGMKGALFAERNRSRLSKKHVEINIVELCKYCESAIGLNSPRISLNTTDFRGSLIDFACAVVGSCLIYAKSIEILQRDCEAVARRKSHVASGGGLVLVVNDPKRRRTSTSSSRNGNARSSRRSSAVSVSPIVGDGLIDLDALCDELSRASPVALPLKVATGSPQSFAKGKRPRSGSSVSEEDFEVPAFDAEEPLVPVHHASETEILTVVEVVTPDPVAGPKKKLKGFDTRISLTDVQWARMMTADDISRDHNICTADLARRGTVNSASYRCVLWSIPRAERAESIVSEAEAVDDLDSIIDELRADDIDHMAEPAGTSRPSIGSSFANSRRQSIASDILFNDLEIEDATSIKKVIESQLTRLGAKKERMIDFTEIVPTSNSSKSDATVAFVKLLELASHNEIRFTKTKVVCISNSYPSFIVGSTESASSSSSSSNDYLLH